GPAATARGSRPGGSPAPRWPARRATRSRRSGPGSRVCGGSQRFQPPPVLLLVDLPAGEPLGQDPRRRTLVSTRRPPGGPAEVPDQEHDPDNHQRPEQQRAERHQTVAPPAHVVVVPVHRRTPSLPQPAFLPAGAAGPARFHRFVADPARLPASPTIRRPGPPAKGTS